MYKPDDNDIDRLSKNAAEHYHAPGEPSWDTLQQLLDKELPLEKEKKRRGFFFFFFLLMGLSAAGSLAWYATKQYNQNKTDIALTAARAIATEPIQEIPSAKQSDAATKEPTTGKSTNAGKAIAENKTEATNEAIAYPDKEAKNSQAVEGNTNTDNNKRYKTGIDKPAAVIAKPVKNSPPKAIASKLKNSDGQSLLPVSENSLRNKPVTTNKNSSKQIPGKNSLLPALNSPANTQAGKLNKNKPSLQSAGIGQDGNDDIINDNRIHNKRNKKAGNQSYVASVPGTKNTQEQKNGGERDAESNSSNPVEEKNSEVAVAAAPDAAKADTSTATAQLPVAKPVTKDSVAAAKTKKKQQPSRAVNIGLTGGADFSTVRFTNSDKPGYNIGIVGGYQFSKHWSVYTGLVYTKKNYTLNGKDYHPPQHYFTYYVDLQKVDGDCHMWEVPLLARYTFNPGSKSAFFASAGLSSYFMKKQSYDYMYLNSWSQPMTGSWATDSTFTHAFSILHISGGIEKRIGKNMNFQVEPYAKIPLGGVGFGNIRLSSFGVNFTVQYRYPVKR